MSVNNSCELGNNDSNKYDIVLSKLLNEVEELCKTSTAKFLFYDKKVAELCTHIKENLSNSIRCLLADMQLSGELDNIISEVVLLKYNNLEIKVNDILNKTEKNITPQMFGAMGDGVFDDTESIKKAVDYCKAKFTVFGSTSSSIQPKLHFPCGKYLISETIVIENKWLNIDFGNAVFVKDFEGGFLFDITTYKNKVSGGIFMGDNIFNIHNPNDDQGHAIFEKQEFKKALIGFQVDMQSSKVTIRDNTFDDVLHPVIQIKSDGLTFENNWCTCPIPSDYDSNFIFKGGSTLFNNNLLVPIVGTLNGVETAWIENKQRSLTVTNNRFGGENGSRTAVNHKFKYTLESSTYLKFTGNLVASHRDEKSGIRLYTLPNTFIYKENYYGCLMPYAISITRNNPYQFNADLEEIKKMYFSTNLQENHFAYPKFRLFQYEVDNNFKNTRNDINDKYREIERENELWFLLENYNKVDTLNGKTLKFGWDYKSQQLPENKGTKQNALYYFPLCIESGVRMTVRFNPNSTGSGYNVVKQYNVYKTFFYNGALQYKFVVEDLNPDVYPDDINSSVSIGHHNGDTADFSGNYTSGNLFVALKIKNTSVENVRVTFSLL